MQTEVAQLRGMLGCSGFWIRLSDSSPNYLFWRHFCLWTWKGSSCTWVPATKLDHLLGHPSSCSLPGPVPAALNSRSWADGWKILSLSSLLFFLSLSFSLSLSLPLWLISNKWVSTSCGGEKKHRVTLKCLFRVSAWLWINRSGELQGKGATLLYTEGVTLVLNPHSSEWNHFFLFP